MNEITQTLTLRGLDSQAIDDAMAAALRDRGYTVLVPSQQRPVITGNLETPSQLAARLDLHPGSVSRTLGRADCPTPQHVNRGPQGRLINLVSTPEVDAFLLRHKN